MAGIAQGDRASAFDGPQLCSTLIRPLAVGHISPVRLRLLLDLWGLSRSLPRFTAMPILNAITALGGDSDGGLVVSADGFMLVHRALNHFAGRPEQCASYLLYACLS